MGRTGGMGGMGGHGRVFPALGGVVNAGFLPQIAATKVQIMTCTRPSSSIVVGAGPVRAPVMPDRQAQTRGLLMAKRSFSMRVATIASTALMGVGMAGGLALAGSAPAGASSSTAVMTYNCVFPLIKGQPIQIGVYYTAPASVAPGATFSVTAVQSKTTLPGSLVSLIMSAFKVSKIGGTVTTFDINANGASPSTVNAASTPFSFSYNTQQNVPVTIVTPSAPLASVGPFTAGTSGSVTLSPGDINISATVGTSKVSVDCTPPATLPAGASVVIPIAASSGSTTTTTGSSVPTTATGEPFAGWPYWALISVIGVLGLVSIERSVRVRRRRS